MLELGFKNVFDFAEHQKNYLPYGLRYKLSLTRNNSIDVLKIAAAPAVADAKIEISGKDWFVPHYTPSIEQKAILCEQILSKIPKQRQYVTKTSFIKVVNTTN